ncbi:CaiB/BaiF CoA-transferase family protein [Mycolicibacterium holsaticum]|uniref:CaiB/BaiF CoA-transferase family protein n=1 Tax=Mycolicibacterium holsaticum TaxID=152142 RepID=UPI001C7CF5D9|nr:CoA transferase [Mycolicibacterium holsaticum]MDA4107601.1 caib/baif family protein [Mycolicibacterium holsaticum DSM 44478 = JCM 12374]QZA14934.1 CoA transferase [Mycolicibacterium holsaticum DSM 44478 = JCM 12374]UNC07628.1 CoA transferase [Mycolicibacterium holsaticum DSM 44478 = JCM 12374]
MGDIAPTPLGDLRVVEISDRIAGAYCGKLLVDAGADVVKVEPPEGDPFRRYTLTGAAPPEGADSPLFSYLNSGKQSVTSCSDDLLAGADIVVLTANRTEAEAQKLDPQRLGEIAPNCVVVTVSDFGWAGPWAQRPATEFTLQAASGLTGFRGDPAGPPISIGGELGEFMGGVWAAYGALALHRRVRTGGPGGHLDMSMLEAVTLMQSGEWLHSQLLQVPPVRRSVEVPSIEQAKDGYVGISMVTGQQWLDFAAMVECSEFTEVPALQFQIGRWDYREWIRERIDPWLRARTVEEIVELGQLFRLPLAPLGNGATIPAMDHMQQRGVYVDNPAGFRQPRPPWLMSEARPAPLRRAPSVGDSDGERPWQPRASTSTASCGVRPLSGVRIVDFTAFWAGPAATHALAAFGADVIKIESVQRPDGIRYSGGMRKDVDDWWEYGWVFHAMNTNKRSVTLDLQSPDGLRLVKELVRKADAVVENFSPRVMDQFGLGADVLLDINPRLVLMRMPAFGLSGPWRDRVGFAPTMEQIAGLAWVTGLPDGPPIAPRGACDPLAGAHAGFALLAALEYAERTGRGQLVEVPMIETVLNVTAAQTMEYEVFGQVMERRGNRGRPDSDQDVYPCAGQDTWVAVSARTDAQRAALASLTGGALDQWLASRDAEAAVETLVQQGIPAAVVISPSLVVENPQLLHRGFFEKLDHPSTGAGWYPCPPFARPDGVDAWLYRTPPRLGEHNAEVLSQLCGLEDAELDRLSADDVIGTRPKGL